MKRLIFILLFLASCTEPSTNTYLKHQKAIILHDNQGRVFVATHLRGDTWDLH